MRQREAGHRGEGKGVSPPGPGDEPEVPRAQGLLRLRLLLRRPGWLAFFDRNRPVWLGMLLIIASMAAGLVMLGRPVSPPQDRPLFKVSEQAPVSRLPAVSSLPPRSDAPSARDVAMLPEDLADTTDAPPGPRTAAIPQGDLARPLRAGRVGIVIDDIGWSQGIVQQLRSIDPAIDLAIMPFTPYSVETAREAYSAGMEVLVHVPMEPHGEVATNPENGMLLSFMPPADMAAQLRRCIEAVPYAVGINNHMGSKLTEDAAAMAVVMAGVQQFGLFFLDSATTPCSMACDVAGRLNVPVARRNVFLDTDLSLDAILAQLAELGEIARREGFAIGIGHPHPVTLEALRRGVPHLRQEGLEIVPVSRLVE